MKNYEYNPACWPDIAGGQSREWSIQNGAGGYAGGTVALAPARRHQGLLVASLHAPVRRQMVWTRCEELLIPEEGACARLDSECFADDTNAADGRTFLQRFVWDGLPVWDYAAGGIHVVRALAMERGANTTALCYTVTAGAQGGRLLLTPRWSWRGAGEASTPASWDFRLSCGTHQAVLSPAAAPAWRVRVSCTAGSLQPLAAVQLSRPLYLSVESETGDDRPERDCALFTAQVSLVPNSTLCFSLTASLESAAQAENPLPDGFALVRAERARQAQILTQAGFSDSSAQRLVLSADQFLVRRASTGGMTMLAGLPWFTDWGRDTMIAFEGCCLCTRRFSEARSILETFALYEKDGLVPNMFPDSGCAPLYNTADASLWYICAVWRYLQFSGSGDDWNFVHRRLWPCICAILRAYTDGTRFSIGMDDADGLMCAGGGLDQVTWMDVRVGDWVVTPRHGKPVEINALWYAALRIGAELARRFAESEAAALWAGMADRVQMNFAPAFWNESAGCLYDVLTPEGPDDTLRPNQLLAISLWRLLPESSAPLLSGAQAASVLRLCEEKLYAGAGMRTLPPEHAHYHGHYIGPLQERDAAYHQGTAWGWLTGEFLFAHLSVHRGEAGEAQVLRRLIAPALASMAEGGINGIAEIFDADAPHCPRGCFSQAWSVGEILSAWRAILQLDGEKSASEKSGGAGRA